jgi:hypothetical protein
MSKGYRNGAFALGLVVGGGIALNVFLWLDYRANYKSYAAANSNSNENSSEIGKLWDRVLGVFVSPSDTLAQWIMAVFTIAVVFLVWRTLVATQEMARDTRHIGEAQTRAYLSFDSVEAVFLNDGDGFTGVYLRPRIKNTGQTPARISLTHSFIYISEDRPSEVRSADTGETSTMRVGSQNSVFLDGGVVLWDDLKVAIEKNYFVVLVCGVDFEDVFFKQGEDRRIEDFAVRVVFNGQLKDPLGSIENQPVCEWRDMQLDVIRAKP